jgi:hypothetical protein
MDMKAVITTVQMTRRTCFTVVAATLAANSILQGKENDTMRELLEASQNEKKGIMLYVKGQSIGGIVVKVAADTVELRSREYSRIVVRIDAIDAAAMS